MAVIHPSLFFVIERFPNHKNALGKMYRTNETFQDICRNYQECSEALVYWAKSEDDNAPEREKEYAALLMELELEIARYLESSV